MLGVVGQQPLPGSALGKAIAFALGQWPKLIRYLDHPQLTPDNNSCEQAIRPFVIGRKNWLVGHPEWRRRSPSKVAGATASFRWATGAHRIHR